MFARPWEYCPSRPVAPHSARAPAARAPAAPERGHRLAVSVPPRRRAAGELANCQTIAHQPRRKEPTTTDPRPTRKGQCRPRLLLYSSSYRFLTEIAANSSHLVMFVTTGMVW